MKKLIVLLTALMMFPLTGCMGELTLNNMSRDIAKYELVQTIGVDSYASDGVTVSVSAPAVGDDASPLILTGTGGTVIGALEKLHNYAPKDKIFYAHTKNYIIGEDAAKSNIPGYLDFIERDMNMRLDTALFIVKEGTAEDLVTQTGEDDTEITQILLSMQKNTDLLSDCKVFTCGEVAANLAEYGCSLVAAVSLIEAENVVSGAGTMTALPAGYGIIKDGRLIDYVDAELVSGANVFIDGGMDADVMEIDDGYGGVMAFRTTLTRCEPEPVYENGVLQYINVNVTLTANIDSVSSNIDIYDNAVLSELESKISAEQEKRIEEILTFSQDLDTDFLAIGRRIELKAPVKFAKMPDKWEDIFSETMFNLSVDTDIERTYDMREPAGVSGENNA